MSHGNTVTFNIWKDNERIRFLNLLTAVLYTSSSKSRKGYQVVETRKMLVVEIYFPFDIPRQTLTF